MERWRVGICDDQEAFRRLLVLALGLEPDLEVVAEATDGSEAIELVREHRPDVLLLDVAMPVMDGLEALPRIREAAPGTDVVMLTAVSAADVRRRALDGGAVLFVEKGGDVEALVAQVRAVCRERG